MLEGEVHKPSILEDTEAQSTENEDKVRIEVHKNIFQSCFSLLFGVYFNYLLSASILSKNLSPSENPYALCIISAILISVTGGLTAVQVKFPQNPYTKPIIFLLLPMSIVPTSLYLSGGESIQVGCTMTSLMAVCLAIVTFPSPKEGILWRRGLLTLVPTTIQMSLLGISYKWDEYGLLWTIILLTWDICIIFSIIANVLKKLFPEKTYYLPDCSIILRFGFAIFWIVESMGLSNSLRAHENLDFKILSMISVTSVSLTVTGIFNFISYKHTRGEVSLKIPELAFLTALPFVITMIIDNLVHRTLALL